MKVTFATCFSACLFLAAAEAGITTNNKLSPARKPAGYQLDESFVMNKATVKRYSMKYQKKKLKARSLPTRYLARRGLFKRKYVQDDSQPQSDTSNNPQPTCNNTVPAMTTVDLTPADPDAGACYPGYFQPPPQADCDVVIQAQLYNSTGSLVAYPGSVVFVTYGKCATVFQNPEDTPYTFEYNWAELGKTTKHLAENCLTSASASVGGVFVYTNYLNYTLPNVMISLQRYDDRDAECPLANDTPLTSTNSGSGQPQPVDSKPAQDQYGRGKPVDVNPASQKPVEVNPTLSQAVEVDPNQQQSDAPKTDGDKSAGHNNEDQYYSDKANDPNQDNGEVGQ